MTVKRTWPCHERGSARRCLVFGANLRGHSRVLVSQAYRRHGAFSCRIEQQSSSPFRCLMESTISFVANANSGQSCKKYANLTPVQLQVARRLSSNSFLLLRTIDTSCACELEWTQQHGKSTKCMHFRWKKTTKKKQGEEDRLIYRQLEGGVHQDCDPVHAADEEGEFHHAFPIPLPFCSMTFLGMASVESGTSAGFEDCLVAQLAVARQRGSIGETGPWALRANFQLFSYLCCSFLGSANLRSFVFPARANPYRRWMNSWIADLSPDVWPILTNPPQINVLAKRKLVAKSQREIRNASRLHKSISC